MEETDPIIASTIAALQPLFPKPKLSAQYLAKPPFKFLWQILRAVAENSGYGASFMTEKDADIEAIHSDKAAKTDFLQRWVDGVTKDLGGSAIDISVGKILAGKEPEKTNAFLQAVAKAAAAKSAPPVETPKKTPKKKAGDAAAAAPAPAAEGGKKGTKKKAGAAAGGEKKATKGKKKAGAKAAAAADEEPEAQTPKPQEDEEAKKAAQQEQEEEEAKKKAAAEAEEAKKKAEEEAAAAAEAAKKKAEEEAAQAQAEAEAATQQQQQQQPTESKRQQEALTARKADKSPKPKDDRTLTAARAPPKIGGAMRAVDNAGVASMPKVALVNEKEEDKDDDEDIIVVQEQAAPAVDMTASQVVAGSDPSKAGIVVREIQKAMQDLATPDTKAADQGSTVLSVAERRRVKLEKEVGKLKGCVQNICQAANPVSKALDFFQEDLDSMDKDLEMWKTESASFKKALESEEVQTKAMLQPYYIQIQEQEQQIKDQEAKIAALKAQIADNATKISHMLKTIF